jgi:hypothetical protein
MHNISEQLQQLYILFSNDDITLTSRVHVCNGRSDIYAKLESLANAHLSPYGRARETI